LKEIVLRCGNTTIVDDEDYEKYNANRWHIDKEGCVARRSLAKGKWTRILLHRLINQTPAHLDTEHINGNKLDNRKSNLRSCSHSESEIKKPKVRGGSCFKGVSWHRASSRWQVSIQKDGVKYDLGLFDNEVDAARAYNLVAERLYGDRAYRNAI
jgi:hypothetical protein